MAFNYTVNLLPPHKAYGPRKGTEGIVFHTDEGRDSSLSSALGTYNFQLNNLGSYNFIIYDGGVLLTVGYRDASGGLATGGAPYWQPGRYPHLKQFLSPAAYADPNAYLMNVAFAGKTAVLSQNMPDNMIDSAAELVKWVEESDWGNDDLLLTGHFHWQTNRSDPSQIVLDNVLGRYEELFVTSAPAEVPADYEALYQAELAKVGSLVSKIQEKNAGIDRVKARMVPQHEENMRSLDWIKGQ